MKLSDALAAATATAAAFEKALAELEHTTGVPSAHGPAPDPVQSTTDHDVLVSELVKTRDERDTLYWAIRRALGHTAVMVQPRLSGDLSSSLDMVREPKPRNTE